MKNIVISVLLLTAVACPAALTAQTLPDLKNQAGWKENDKQEFLKFLKSGQQAPVSGQVKSVPGESGRSRGPRKARYFTLAMASESIITVASSGQKQTLAPAFGPQLLAGGHLFSWIRYYGGLKYSLISQQRVDGGHSRLKHYEIPAGIELALIPLGTPQTRYVLLRLGVSSHYFSGSGNKTDFSPALLGWHEAWNAGIGYEWQFSDSNFRANILAEGCKSIIKSRSPEFYRTGVTAGLSYTF